MAVNQIIEIDGRQVPFKASAMIPRIYRFRFRRDIFSDMRRLIREVNDSDANESRLDLNSLEVFEDIAYTMAKYADPAVPETPEEWLDGFSTFSIYKVLPELLKLWGLNMETEVEQKKSLARLTAH